MKLHRITQWKGEYCQILRNFITKLVTKWVQWHQYQDKFPKEILDMVKGR